MEQQKRGALVLASDVRPGDGLIAHGRRRVQRTMGVQGRKPKDGAPLMRIVLEDGEALRVREDEPLRIVHRSSAPTP